MRPPVKFSREIPCAPVKFLPITRSSQVLLKVKQIYIGSTLFNLVILHKRLIFKELKDGGGSYLDLVQVRFEPCYYVK